MYEIDRTTVVNTDPYQSICYISCEWADGSFTRASGVIVGANDVLTAHHVVYDATRGGYATRIVVTPAADTYPYFVAPYGSYSDVGVVYARTPDWDANGDGLLYPSESQYDLALLGMRSTAISDRIGWANVSNTSFDFSGKMEGYPARGTGLMEQPAFADASVDYGVFDIFGTAGTGSLGPGASGGPLMRSDATGDYVVGVLSSGNSDYSHSTYAGLFGPGNWTWLTNALASDNSLLPGGASGNVPLSGPAAGVITYLGTIAGDVLIGTAADESLRGGGGIDWLNGEGGWDTALYLGPRAGYRLGHNETGISVADTQPGRDGNDNLAHIERIEFADMSVTLQIGDLSRSISPYQLKTLEELYVAFFDRVPEAEGLAFWIDQVRAGVSIDYVADAFYSAAVGYPTLTGYTPGMSDAQFVSVIYRNVLGRTDGGDSGGLAFWTARAAVESRGTLVTEMLWSAHSFKGDPTWGWVADLLDNKAFVAQRFAVEMGLSYATPEASIAHGMQIADAVTPTDTSQAIALIGVPDPFSTLG